MQATVVQSPVPAPHPLKDSTFRMFWAGWTISLLGDQFYLVALPWLVLQQTGSAVATSAILMAASIPRAVLLLVGGVVTDRMSPRRIIIATALARTLLVAAVGLLVQFRILHIWELYVLGFAFGVADAFGLPAGQKLLPFIVQREQLVKANSVFQSTAQLTTIAGPTPAGVVIRTLGIAWAFFIDAVSFLFLIGALLKLPDPPASASTQKATMWRAISEGIRYVLNDVPLRSLLTLTTVMNFCIAGPLGVGLAYLARTRFHTPTAYGGLVSSIALGALAGSLIAGIVHFQRRGLLILAVCTALGVLIGLIGSLRSFWMVSATLVAMGACSGLANVQIVSWLQKRIDVKVRGRVLSVLTLSMVGMAPISIAITGVVVSWNIAALYLLASGIMLTATVAAMFVKPVREIG